MGRWEQLKYRAAAWIIDSDLSIPMDWSLEKARARHRALETQLKDNIWFFSVLSQTLKWNVPSAWHWYMCSSTAVHVHVLTVKSIIFIQRSATGCPRAPSEWPAKRFRSSMAPNIRELASGHHYQSSHWFLKLIKSFRRIWCLFVWFCCSVRPFLAWWPAALASVSNVARGRWPVAILHV